MIDLFKYNALKEDANLGVFEADFAATPDLCSNRTANAQVMTHAVIEPFIYYEPVEGEEEGREEVSKGFEEMSLNFFSCLLLLALPLLRGGVAQER